MRAHFDPAALDVPRLLAALRIDAEHVGDRWVGKCPSGRHPDNKPSWDIKDDPDSERHGLQRCFSCGWGGTATDLVMRLTNILDVGVAREWMAEHAMGAAPIPTKLNVEFSAPDAAFKLPPETVVAPLAEWPGPVAAYVRQRGLSAAQVARWGLGYATTGRLAGRIIVPARDAKGRPVHYTARSFAGSPKRYIEPRREEGADPGAVFGEQLWNGQREVVAVTEGAFNVLAIERVAPRIALASLFGSDVHVRHLQKLSSFRAGLLITDPDMAGDRAAEKISQALARHLVLERVILPAGKDADDAGPEALRAALEIAWRKLAARGITQGSGGSGPTDR
jgi:hypothetical protein